jgi:hypothetical protein
MRRAQSCLILTAAIVVIAPYSAEAIGLGDSYYGLTPEQRAGVLGAQRQMLEKGAPAAAAMAGRALAKKGVQTAVAAAVATVIATTATPAVAGAVAGAVIAHVVLTPETAQAPGLPRGGEGDRGGAGGGAGPREGGGAGPSDRPGMAEPRDSGREEQNEGESDGNEQNGEGNDDGDKGADRPGDPLGPELRGPP